MGSVQLIKEMVNDGINENPETDKRRFGAQQNLLSVWSVSTSCALENRKKKKILKTSCLLTLSLSSATSQSTSSRSRIPPSPCSNR